MAVKRLLSVTLTCRCWGTSSPTLLLLLLPLKLATLSKQTAWV